MKIAGTKWEQPNDLGGIVADHSWLAGRSTELVAAAERGDYRRAEQLIAHVRAEGGLASAEHLVDELCAEIRGLVGRR